MIQTIGRAARNVNGTVIMYADRITDSMKVAIDLTRQRRQRQQAYNEQHSIVPKTIYKRIQESLVTAEEAAMVAESEATYRTSSQLETQIKQFENEMRQAAEILNFERAAELRDQITLLKNRLIGLQV